MSEADLFTAVEEAQATDQGEWNVYDMWYSAIFETWCEVPSDVCVSVTI